jgi:hypothetical protein
VRSCVFPRRTPPAADRPERERDSRLLTSRGAVTPVTLPASSSLQAGRTTRRDASHRTSGALPPLALRFDTPRARDRLLVVVDVRDDRARSASH